MCSLHSLIVVCNCGFLRFNCGDVYSVQIQSHTEIV